jgi:hypothetical protein
MTSSCVNNKPILDVASSRGFGDTFSSHLLSGGALPCRSTSRAIDARGEVQLQQDNATKKTRWENNGQVARKFRVS